LIVERRVRALTGASRAESRPAASAVVRIHPDADSMAFHMDVVAKRAAAAYAETIDATTGIQVFGTPSNAIVEMLQRQAGAGVPLVVKPTHLGGFVRR
jgi:biotin carboxylase